MKFDKFCKKQEIGYQNINNKEIENIFLKLDSKTLIISANIFFIFTMESGGSLYYKSQLPNGSIFDSAWDIEHKRKFLRAFVCGNSKLLNPPKVIINNSFVEIIGYNKDFTPIFKEFL